MKPSLPESEVLATEKQRETVVPLQAPQTQPPEREPIAIVGIGCRLPGGVTDEEPHIMNTTSGADFAAPARINPSPAIGLGV